MNDLTPTAAAKSHSFRDLAPQFGKPVGWLRPETDRLFREAGGRAHSVFYRPVTLAKAESATGADTQDHERGGLTW